MHVPLACPQCGTDFTRGKVDLVTVRPAVVLSILDECHVYESTDRDRDETYLRCVGCGYEIVPNSTGRE